MAVEVNILVCVCGLAIDVKIECAVGVVDDGDVQHGDAAILLDLFGPLDVGMNGVEIVVQWLDVVVVYGDESVVGFSQPEENDVTGRDGIVTSGVLGKGFSLKIFHIYVGKRAAGGFAHPKSLELPIEVAPPSEIGQVEVEFDQGQDVVDPDGGAFLEIPVAFKFFLN